MRKLTLPCLFLLLLEQSSSFTNSSCENGKQLAFFGNDKFTFAEAVAACSSFPQGFISRVDSTALRASILNLVGNQNNGFKIWVGLKDKNDVGGGTATRFDFLDNENGDKSFFSVVKKNPWDSSEPNDLGSENCVEWDIPTDRWNDVQCESNTNKHGLVCRFSCVTPAPTKNPTKTPTKFPTSSPTKTPTSSPTPNPTLSPTLTPTSTPTETPTNAPSTSPTEAPTIVLQTAPLQDIFTSTIFIGLFSCLTAMIAFVGLFIAREKLAISKLEENMKEIEEFQAKYFGNTDEYI